MADYNLLYYTYFTIFVLVDQTNFSEQLVLDEHNLVTWPDFFRGSDTTVETSSRPLGAVLVHLAQFSWCRCRMEGDNILQRLFRNPMSATDR